MMHGVETDGCDRSVWADVTVRVTELGIEEVEANGRVSRMPFGALRRWPTVSHGMVSFIAADHTRDSANPLGGGMGVANHDDWDGRGMGVPLSLLDRPWRLVWQVHRLRGPARRRFRRANRIAGRVLRRGCPEALRRTLVAEFRRLVGRDLEWAYAGGADVVLGNGG